MYACVKTINIADYSVVPWGRYEITPAVIVVYFFQARRGLYHCIYISVVLGDVYMFRPLWQNHLGGCQEVAALIEALLLNSDVAKWVFYILALKVFLFWSLRFSGSIRSNGVHHFWATELPVSYGGFCAQNEQRIPVECKCLRNLVFRNFFFRPSADCRQRRGKI